MRPAAQGQALGRPCWVWGGRGVWIELPGTGHSGLPGGGARVGDGHRSVSSRLWLGCRFDGNGAGGTQGDVLSAHNPELTPDVQSEARCWGSAWTVGFWAFFLFP